MSGIISYGTYLPHWRLERRAVAAALGAGATSGARAVASYDEDAATMAVEAARDALHAAPGPIEPATVLFATTSPPYLDKTNATAIHAALGLRPDAGAYDAIGSTRSTIGALRAALHDPQPTLVTAGDIRIGMPGSADEVGGGDGAGALLVGNDQLVAELVGTGAATGELLDRWREPGDTSSRHWEERFAEGIYASLADDAVDRALKDAQSTAGDIDRLAVTGVHPRAVRRVAKALEAAGGPAVLDDLAGTVGNTGAAHPLLLLAAALDRAGPDQLIALVVLADGADVLVFRTTAALLDHRARRAGSMQDDAVDRALPYASFLTWRGLLPRESPRRPDPIPPAAPPSQRHTAWKFGFTAARCGACGARHLPPARVCVACGAADQMAGERLADVRGTVVTFTVDHLAHSLHPPVVVAVIDFDGGGRFQCEMTDVDPAAVSIGDRVEMTFRRLFTAGGVHNYFWKARPARGRS